MEATTYLPQLLTKLILNLRVMVVMCAKFQLPLLRLHAEPWESMFQSAGFRAQPAVITAQLPLMIAVHLDTLLCHHE